MACAHFGAKAGSSAATSSRAQCKTQNSATSGEILLLRDTVLKVKRYAHVQCFYLQIRRNISIIKAEKMI